MEMLTLLNSLPKSQQRSYAGVHSKSSSAKRIKTQKETFLRTAALPVHLFIIQKLEEPSHHCPVVNAHPAGLRLPSEQSWREVSESPLGL